MADNNVSFLTIGQFKEQVGASSIQVLRNKKTGKLFMSADTGETYKVEQDIDPSKEIKVLVPEGDITEACLVNINGGAEEVFSL